MAYEVRDNSGTLFRNDKKRNEKSPEYTGAARIDGVDYWINGWVKESKNGTKFFSFAFKAKDAPKQQSKPASTSLDDDSVPF